MLIAAFAGAAEPNPTNSIRLTPAFISTLAEEMRTNQPALRAWDARIRAAVLATNAIRTWDDPMAKIGGVIASERGPVLEEDGDLIYELEQKLPLFGRASTERRMAQAESDVTLARRDMRFQFSRRDLARLMFALAYDDAALEVGQRDLARLTTMAGVVDEQLRAGRSTQIEFLRLQNERSKRADQLITDKQLREQTRLSINRLVNRPLAQPLAPMQLPEAWPPLPSTSRLVDYAVKFEPNLRVMTREVSAAEAQVAVTRKARLPEVVAGIEGRQYSGDGNFREGQFTVGLSLPWLNRGRYRSAIARDQARLEAVRLDRVDEELRVREDVHRQIVEIDTARREALLYRDEILPRARQAMEVAQSNWAAGRGLFMETMEARRMLLEAELVLARAISRQYQSLSELILCCGLGDFEALEILEEKQ